MSDHEHIFEEVESPFFGHTSSRCTLCGAVPRMIERAAATPRLDLVHEGCGGFIAPSATQGPWHFFRCDVCKYEVVAERSLVSLEMEKRRREEFEERMRQWVPPEPQGRELSVDEVELLDEYREWSEDRYAAGFMSPSEDVVKQFLRRNDPVEGQPPTPRKAWDYEEEFLEVYKRLTEDGDVA